MNGREVRQDVPNVRTHLHTLTLISLRSLHDRYCTGARTAAPILPASGPADGLSSFLASRCSGLACKEHHAPARREGGSVGCGRTGCG